MVQFRIDEAHANAMAGMPDPRRMRFAQELGVLQPVRSGLRIAGTVRERVPLGPFATALVWITPYRTAVPATPTWLEASREGGNVVLRWTPDRTASFYSYEVSRTAAGDRPVSITPDPLRAAMWIDTAAPDAPLRYTIRTVSASGVRSRPARSRPV